MNIQKVDIFSPYSGLNGWFTNRNTEKINTAGEIPGLNCGFHTSASRKEVGGNRQMLFESLGLKYDDVAFAGQIHGNQISTVCKGGLFPDTDALVTTVQGISLAIQIADCAAVLIADPDSPAIGAVHAGWRGTAHQIIPLTIQKMVEDASARPDRMLAYVSPCISQRHFEVGPEVAQYFPEEFTDSISYSKPHVDLRKTIRKQLSDSGIPETQIDVDPGCTYRDHQRYYSWRREREQSGRMLAIIRLV